MNKGNDLFVSAQTHHKAVIKCRSNASYNDSLINDCYDAIVQYLDLLLPAVECKKQENLLITVSYLKSNGISLGDRVLDYVFVLQAMHEIKHTADTELLHKLVYSYMSLRTLILEYMLDNFEPIYRDRHVCHEVTGVVLKAPAFAYRFTLEKYYEI